MREIGICNEVAKKILGVQKKEYPNSEYKMHDYIMEVHDNIGHTYLCNLLTDQIVELEENETLNIDYAIATWWMLPKYIDAFSFVATIKQLARNKEWVCHYYDLKDDEIGSLLILTTTGCNARCNYCFEKGAPIDTMNLDTAEKVVQYIKGLNPQKPIILEWFGGEPLCNTFVIDYITSRCEEEHIPFVSKIVTNAYLADDVMVEKLDKWRLNGAQITLDGYGEDYNIVKQYVNPNRGDPFTHVIDNIKLLIENNVNVSVRLNCTPYNSESIKKVIHLLSEIYKKLPDDKKYLLAAYTAPVYAMGYTKEEIDLQFQKMMELENYFVSEFENVNVSCLVKSTYAPCSASLLHHVTILPNGDFTNCDILLNNPDIIAGNAETGIQLSPHLIDKINEWEEHVEGTQEICKTCKVFPRCWRIKKCIGRAKCTPTILDYYYNSMELEMIDRIRREG